MQSENGGQSVSRNMDLRDASASKNISPGLGGGSTPLPINDKEIFHLVLVEEVLDVDIVAFLLLPPHSPPEKNQDHDMDLDDLNDMLYEYCIILIGSK